MFIFMVIVLLLLFLGIYFIPSFVAISRKHSHVLQITILNTFLGWSFIAWVLALIWATTNYTNENVKTKACWIIIAVVFVLTLLPALSLAWLPKTISQESQFFYKSNSNGVIQEVTKIRRTIR